MNQKYIILIACGLILLPVSAIAVKKPTSKSTNQAVVTQLTQQIAELEVKQALLEPTFTPDAPKLAQLIREQARLKQHLAQLQPRSYQTQIAAATTNALKSKLADLEAQYAKDKATFTDTHPLQQQRRAQINIIRKRLAVLR